MNESSYLFLGLRPWPLKLELLSSSFVDSGWFTMKGFWILELYGPISILGVNASGSDVSVKPVV
jgi:hypothetical protein